MKLLSYDYFIVCYVLIGVGVFVIIIGFIGCCGGLKEYICMLKIVRGWVFIL